MHIYTCTYTYIYKLRNCFSWPCATWWKSHALFNAWFIRIFVFRLYDLRWKMVDKLAVTKAALWRSRLDSSLIFISYLMPRNNAQIWPTIRKQFGVRWLPLWNREKRTCLSTVQWRFCGRDVLPVTLNIDRGIKQDVHSEPFVPVAQISDGPSYRAHHIGLY